MSCFSEQVNMMMMKVKLIFRGAWKSLIAWHDWPDKNRKNTVLSVCSKDLQFWISFSSISVPKVLLVSVQFEKIPILFQFLRLLYFQKSYMNIKLRFQVNLEFQVSSQQCLVFKLVLFSQCRFSTVVCPRCAPGIGEGAQRKLGGGRGTLKKISGASRRSLCPNFKTVPAPIPASAWRSSTILSTVYFIQ